MAIDYNKRPKRSGGDPPTDPPPAGPPSSNPPPPDQRYDQPPPQQYGQPSYGQPPPPQYGQPPAGQPYGQPPPQQQYGQPPQQPYGQPAPINMSKVTLTKSAPAISLSKSGGATGVMRVNLNWDSKGGAQQGGGFFKRMASAAGGSVDLDLGCLYEYSDGSKGVVQALGNAFRGQHTMGNGEAIVWLDGDDRSGSNVGGENLFIDLRHTARISRIIVFALIYEGAPNWAAAKAVVTMFPASGPQVEVFLDEPDPRARICAIALLQNRNGELVVNREVRYINGGQDKLDESYGWGMNWKAGRK